VNYSSKNGILEAESAQDSCDLPRICQAVRIPGDRDHGFQAIVITHWSEEFHRLVGKRPKALALVKPLGVLVLGVDNNREPAYPPASSRMSVLFGRLNVAASRYNVD
jgi:hypothetical protein